VLSVVYRAFAGSSWTTSVEAGLTFAFPDPRTTYAVTSLAAGKAYRVRGLTSRGASASLTTYDARGFAVDNFLLLEPPSFEVTVPACDAGRCLIYRVYRPPPDGGQELAPPLPTVTDLSTGLDLPECPEQKRVRNSRLVDRLVRALLSLRCLPRVPVWNSLHVVDYRWHSGMFSNPCYRYYVAFPLRSLVLVGRGSKHMAFLAGNLRTTRVDAAFHPAEGESFRLGVARGEQAPLPRCTHALRWREDNRCPVLIVKVWYDQLMDLESFLPRAREYL